jgi:hypothetical protein
LANPSLKLHGDFYGKMGFTKEVETTYSGWWLSPTPLKNMKVNGKDYPIYCGKTKHVPNHQPVLDILDDINSSNM